MATLLDNGFTIISYPTTYEFPLAVNYGLVHYYEDLKIFSKIASEKDPNYTESLRKHLLRNNKLSHFNMFVMKWEDFDKYCTWLFGSLEETEKYIKLETYSSVQKRIYGYIAERMLNVFCISNNLKTKFVPIVQFINEKNLPNVYFFYRLIRCNISNFFVRTPVPDIAWQGMMDHAEKLMNERKL